MKKVITFTILIILVLSLVLSANVSAEVIDPLIVLKNPSQSVCPCKSVTYELEITNNGQHEDIFTLSSNLFDEHFQYSENPVILESEETKTVYVFVGLPCEEFGVFNPFILVHSNNINSDYGVPLTLNVLSCYDYSLDFVEYNEEGSTLNDVEEYSLCPGDSTEIPVLIKNDAEFDNLYYFKLEGAEWVTMGQENAIVPEKSSRLVLLDVEVPKDFLGKDSVTFSSYSSRGEEYRTALAILNVEKCYGIELEIEDSVVVCQNEEEEFEFNIKNFGKETSKINFKLDGPDWVSLDKDSLLVVGGQEKNVRVNVNAPNNKKGNYKVEVLAYLDEQDHISDEGVFVIDVNKKGTCDEYADEPIGSSGNSGVMVGIVLLVLVLIIVGFMIYNKKTSKKEDMKEEKKIKKEKKKVSKVVEDEIGVTKKFGNWVLHFVLLIIILVILTAIGIYFMQIIEFLKPYWVYIVVGAVLLVVIVMIIWNHKDQPKNKKIEKDDWIGVYEEEKKVENKKIEKKVKKNKKQLKEESIVKKRIMSVVIGIIVVLAILYVAYYYGLLPHVIDFLKIYYVYLLVGIALIIGFFVYMKQFEK